MTALAAAYRITDSGTGTDVYGNRITTDPLQGQLTIATGNSSVVVNNGNICNTSTNGIVQVTSANPNACAVDGSVQHIWVSAYTIGTSFTVSTGNATSVAGDSTWNYRIVC